jgi:ribosomal-protein-alanine N-acetyltransferase
LSEQEEGTMLPDRIETERLCLRPVALEDVGDILAYATNVEWARYLPVPQPYTRSDAEEFVASQILLDREQTPSWGIVLDGVVIGGINLRMDFENHACELGYGVAREHWGQGFATEAARAVIDVAFQSLPDLNKVRAMADLRNVASQRVMEKVGMTREGVLRQNRLFRGEYVDEVWCGLLRSEWESATSF